MGTRVATADAVLVTSTTTGTGTYALSSAAVASYFHPSDITPSLNGVRVGYVVVDSLTAPTRREVGEGVLTTGSPWTLTRAQVRRSNNNGTVGTSAITWPSGTRYVFITALAANAVQTDTDGWLAIGTGAGARSPLDVGGTLQVGSTGAGDAAIYVGTSSTSAAFIDAADADDSAAKRALLINQFGSAGVFSADIYANTTASAANVTVLATGQLARSTSSAEFKFDIEELDPEIAVRVAEDLRPVWHRSSAPGDLEGWSWFGLIAEEVAAIDRRFVHWRALPEGEAPRDGVPTFRMTVREWVPVHDDDGRPKADLREREAAMVPAGVMYDRVLLVARCGDAILAERRFAAIEARLAALEAG